MDLSTSKKELAKLILEIDNQEIIEKIVHLLKVEKQDFWSKLSNNEKESIQIGIKQLDNGEGIVLEDFIRKV